MFPGDFVLRVILTLGVNTVQPCKIMGLIRGTSDNITIKKVLFERIIRCVAIPDRIIVTVPEITIEYSRRNHPFFCHKMEVGADDCRDVLECWHYESSLLIVQDFDSFEDKMEKMGWEIVGKKKKQPTVFHVNNLPSCPQGNKADATKMIDSANPTKQIGPGTQMIRTDSVCE